VRVTRTRSTISGISRRYQEVARLAPYPIGRQINAPNIYRTQSRRRKSGPINDSDRTWQDYLTNQCRRDDWAASGFEKLGSGVAGMSVG